MTAERTKRSFDTVSVRNFVAKVAISPDRWLDRAIAVVLNVPTPEDQAIANTPPAAALLMVMGSSSVTGDIEFRPARGWEV